jgi:hypoxanthine phosphoribosyltransferase
VDLSTAGADIERVIVTAPEIQARLKEIALKVEADYADKNLLVIGILKGAVMTMADFVRSLNCHVEMDWMAVTSYGSGTKSSGVVRILKDLDRDISGRDVLIVEDIVDTGLTLAWLKSNLQSRGTKSVEILTMLRKPDAA